MKALKIIGIIVGLLVAAILIVPLFSPSPAQVSSEIEITLEPAQIFPSVASFENREEWDPWVSSDSTTVVKVESKPGYVGSYYTWEGEKLGVGRMEVISVTENEYIKSDLYFSGAKTPALVEWTFEPVDGGTHVVWSFSQETTYPFGRLGMMIGAGYLKKSFDTGLTSLKELMESNPPVASPLGPITIEMQPAFEAMVAKGAGTMQTIGQQLGQLFPAVWAELEKQQLSVVGPAFVHYLDFDEATGHSNYLAGFMVDKKGKDAGDVQAASHVEMEVVQGIHTGPYEQFYMSYALMETYIEENGIEVSGEAFEFYTVDMQQEQDPAKLQTVIAFPLK